MAYCACKEKPTSWSVPREGAAPVPMDARSKKEALERERKSKRAAIERRKETGYDAHHPVVAMANYNVACAHSLAGREVANVTD